MLYANFSEHSGYSFPLYQKICMHPVPVSFFAPRNQKLSIVYRYNEF
jgi:hypothetical protein